MYQTRLQSSGREPIFVSSLFRGGSISEPPFFVLLPKPKSTCIPSVHQKKGSNLLSRHLGVPFCRGGMSLPLFAPTLRPSPLRSAPRPLRSATLRFGVSGLRFGAPGFATGLRWVVRVGCRCPCRGGMSLPLSACPAPFATPRAPLRYAYAPRPPCGGSERLAACPSSLRCGLSVLAASAIAQGAQGFGFATGARGFATGAGQSEYICKQHDYKCIQLFTDVIMLVSGGEAPVKYYGGFPSVGVRIGQPPSGRAEVPIPRAALAHPTRSPAPPLRWLRAACGLSVLASLRPVRPRRLRHRAGGAGLPLAHPTHVPRYPPTRYPPRSPPRGASPASRGNHRCPCRHNNNINATLSRCF